MVQYAVRFLVGYITVTVTGEGCERFLTLCARQGLILWEMRIRDGILTACARRSREEDLRKTAVQCGLSFAVTGRGGIQHLWKKYAGSRILIGAAAAVGIYLLLFSRYWSVEVEGNRLYTRQQVLSAAKQAGIYVGAGRGLSTRQAGRKLMQLLPEANWISVNVNGCSAVISLSEATTPVPHTETSPADILADYDGCVVYIAAEQGTACLQPGDSFVRGDMLIAGKEAHTQLLPDGTAQITEEAVRARGEIRAQTVRVFTVQVPAVQTVYRVCGEPVVRRSLQIFGAYLPLTFTLPPQGMWTRHTAEEPLVLHNRLLPLGVYTETFFPVRQETCTFSEEQARQLAQEQLALSIAQTLGEGGTVREILQTEFMQNEDGSYTQTIRCTCEENLGMLTER